MIQKGSRANVPRLRINLTGTFALRILGLAAIITLGYFSVARDQRSSHATPELQPALPEITSPPPLTASVGIFGKNEGITAALAGQSLDETVIRGIVQGAKIVFNLARVIARRPYWIDRTADGRFHDFRYPVDTGQYLTVYRENDRFAGAIYPPAPCISAFAYARFAAERDRLQGQLGLSTE